MEVQKTEIVPITLMTKKKEYDTIKKNITTVCQKLKSIFSNEQIKLNAQSTQFQVREGKIKAHDLFWTLTRCFSTHGAYEVAGLHRSFIHDVHKVYG